MQIFIQMILWYKWKYINLLNFSFFIESQLLYNNKSRLIFFCEKFKHN